MKWRWWILGLAALSAWSQVAMQHAMHQTVDVPQDRPAPAVEIRLSADAADGYNLQLAVRNFRFTPDQVNAAAVPNEGHAHLYLNGAKIGRLYSEWFHIPRILLAEGVNRIRVELNANNHSPWALAGEPVSDEVLLDPAVTNGNPIVRSDLRYLLTWDWGVARHSDGGGSGWSVVNNLGYEVYVESGTVVTRSLELIGCHSAQAMQGALWAPLPFAFAGHGLLTPDKSKIARPYVEDLGRPKDVVTETRTVTVPEYCQAHYLIAIPGGVDAEAPSLEVTGTWRKGRGDAKPFHIRSRSAYGQVKDLAVRQSIVGGMTVPVRRPLGTMFQDVDFARQDEQAQARQVLRTLVIGTQVENVDHLPRN